MMDEGVVPNEETLLVALDACVKASDLKPNYGKLVKMAFGISWTAISAYAQSGHHELMLLFAKMPERSIETWNAMLTALSELGNVADAKGVLDRMPKWNVVSFSAMMTAYARSCQPSEAKRVFDKMPERNEVAWTTLLRAYALTMKTREALQVFQSIPLRHLVTWNAMLAAYAQTGQAALDLLYQMALDGMRPNNVSFIIILNACAHGGLVAQACSFITSMHLDFGITPEREHFCAMIDVFGRAGKMEIAEELYHAMPEKALESEVLLGACNLHGNAQVGARAVWCLTGLEPDIPASYIFLSSKRGQE